MDKLPKVFQNPIDKEIHNYQELFRSNNEIRESNKDINKLINEIFSSSSHVYKSKVKITTSKDIFETDIVGKTNKYLITLDGNKILISNILDIEKL